ncbi:MAG: FAD-dependent oxidoreductase [Cytophagales bacterium]|nr:FAD-dependent oxidoreductase [Cytophagales bacterium]MDW8384310.1 FAD-dependent oxidoreductase [Flammeovirgaceae bacterium]
MKKIKVAFLIGVGIILSSHQTFKTYDVVVYGGTSAGVIAAYSAKKMGKSVLLVEPTLFLGGMSSSGLGETDIGNKYAITNLARDFYRRLGKHYGTFEAWQFEPSVAEKIFLQYIQEANIEVLYQHRIIKAFKENNLLKTITLENSRYVNSPKVIVGAKIFIDCSYEGDLMARAGVSYTVGREDNRQYQETLNGVQIHSGNQISEKISAYIIEGDSTSGLLWGINPEPIQPIGTGDKKIQAYNFRLCLTNNPENRIPFSRPQNYDSTKYEILYRTIKQRAEMGWKQPLHAFFLRMMPIPNQKTDTNNKGGFSTDFIGFNWDYPEANYQQREWIVQQHRQYTEGLLYFLANDPRIPKEIRDEMSQWGFPKDEFPENNGFPRQLYIREARRLIGEYVMTEHNCLGTTTVSDGIAYGAYNMDSHNCDRHAVNGYVINEGDVQHPVPKPYPIAYRAIVPKREECQNLLVPVCLSASHIAYGSIRMEPVFMITAQAAAIAAAIAIEANKAVQEIDIQQLQKIMAENPYLDGSQADIIIDNEHTNKITLKGNWKLNNERHTESNLSSCLMSEPHTPIARVQFELVVPTSGKYNVYFYCPSGGSGKNAITLTDKLPIEILHQQGKSKVVVNQQQYKKNWAPLGSYNFQKRKKYKITVLADRLEKTAMVDAILLVKQK